MSVRKSTIFMLRNLEIICLPLTLQWNLVDKGSIQIKYSYMKILPNFLAQKYITSIILCSQNSDVGTISLI